MLLLTDEFEFICSKKTFNALMEREYVPNFYGYLHYSYAFPDRKDYYPLLLEMLVRGISYIVKRNLKCHDDFKAIIEIYPNLKENVNDFEKVINLKFKDTHEFESYINSFIQKSIDK